MKRRALLAAAAATATGVAGCLRSNGFGGSNPEQTDEVKTDDPADDEPYLEDRSFEVERVECGDEFGGHDVITEDGLVTVEGVLDGNNSCYTAELVRGEYVTEEDTLYVEVESVDGSDADEACSTCIVEIEYVATFEFANGEPGSVRVDQRGQTSGSSSASKSVSAGDGGSGSDTSTGSPTATEFPGTPTPTPD
ncbi:hypothetical protein [Natronomonas sp.]|uniref:hypothetical protein n=1 Tax=Natronomonas sp. TaxID=2184060 RepID=UPI002FC31DDC